MNDEGQALKDSVHLPCPDCDGNIIFTGFTGMVKWFKCCKCGKEFENRRSVDRRHSFTPPDKDRRKV
jgi:uncharacterized protein (DUF983 family)